jgi:hypothetical protein
MSKRFISSGFYLRSLLCSACDIYASTWVGLIGMRAWCCWGME